MDSPQRQPLVEKTDMHRWCILSYNGPIIMLCQLVPPETWVVVGMIVVVMRFTVTTIMINPSLQLSPQTP